MAVAIDKMSGVKTNVNDVFASLNDASDIKKASFDALWESYENKIEEIRDEMIKLEKVIVLKIIDAKWIDHIDLMSKLRDGIHLRSYAQDNPLKAYTQEGYEMFETMMNNISKEVVNFCSSCRIEYGRRQR